MEPLSVSLESTVPSVSSAADTLIIIPAYCEEKNLPSVIARIRQAANFADILVVDDGSRDRTRAVAESLGVFVVSHPINMGYGTALQTGYKFALARGYRYVVQIDGDGQHDPSYIPRLLGPIREGEQDVMLGSRFLDVEAYQVPLARRVGQILFGAIAGIVLKKRISDPTTGYQAMNARVFSLFASDVYPVDYPDADVIIMAHLAGLRIDEVGVRMTANAENRSMHNGLLPFYYVFKMLLSIAVTLLRARPEVFAA